MDGLKHFIVFRKPGSAWVEGKGTREQPAWDEHAHFMDDLHDSGKVLLAGPYADLSRVLLVVRSTSTAEAESLFEPDPWTRMGILQIGGVHEWSPFLRPAGWPE